MKNCEECKANGGGHFCGECGSKICKPPKNNGESCGIQTTCVICVLAPIKMPRPAVGDL